MLKEIVMNTTSFPNMNEQLDTIKRSGRKTYIFGGLGAMSLGSVIANHLIQQNISFDGFLANKEFIFNPKHMGKPVTAIEESNIDKDNNIIIGISKWQLAQEELLKFGYHNIFLFDCFSESVLEQISPDYFQKNYGGFSKTYSMLEDELSKQSMIAYLQGKIFNNFTQLANTCLANLNNKGGGAYFNDIFIFRDDEIMVDCGAFTGDTALMFAQKNPTYKKIYAFEPDKNTYMQLVTNTQKLKITPINKGVFSKTCTLSFDTQDNGCSNFNEDGKLQIEVVSLDEFLEQNQEAITFIKMDIEGSELEALKGASKTIKKYKPKLAICVYHKANDLIEIPKYIKSLHKDYKIFIRNHQMLPEDTVLYAF